VCEQFAQGCYLTAARPGVELATSGVTSQRLNHYTTRPHVLHYQRDKAAKISHITWNTPKGAWIGIFKPNSHRVDTSISSKLHSQFQPNSAQQLRRHQILFVGGSNTCITNLKWRTAAISKKSKNRRLSATVWPIVMKFGMVSIADPLNPISR